ncbi:penicillin-insensitive murein endopeptidase [Falsirhodobacter sp. 20TX0035]|uniref:penicillin-insensitive murein endopeptidase n=1 Tax=Falsirhodobacter sp. 20TX0035 TaxID=3022019 RepID=UPI002330A747|nr:penicillin-insensitive murein endopeptidase [Falsirhodobacter sp. 20TX0035]MDB6452630.1 penicillin-insensitive murein endopeptidase [Falsirhodobacter sp. 20TX0035]
MIRSLAVALGLALALPAGAETPASSLFGGMEAPTGGAAQAIGFYSRGCATGLVPLPETGPTWQAMRLSRNRNWGQPQMVAFLQQLSVAATKMGWAGLYIGDIAQPRGGPAPSGHASHQTGLDADIWLRMPETLRLSPAAREDLPFISVLRDRRTVNAYWTPRHRALVQSAAMDPRVDRIFLNAAIKAEMCRTATPADTAWLQKIRPAPGHDEHMHIRLRCPAGSRTCTPQTPSVAELSQGGSGCDASLAAWLEDRPSAEPSAPARTHPRAFALSDLPAQCSAVLRAR